MYKFEVIDNQDLWKMTLKNFNKIDSYYSYEYGELFAKNENGKLFAIYFEDRFIKVFYPFIKRKVDYLENEIFDIVTPYGYGGPLISGENDQSINEFSNALGEYCKANHIITETIRFHPLYRNYQLCEKILDVQYIRKTTGVDLTSSLEKIRSNYTSMNKRNIKKAKKNHLTCFIAEKNKKNIEVFRNLYKETMDKNNAASYYYFDESYFSEQVKDTDISKTYLLFTKMNNEIIAGVMVIVGQEFAHYHLGASKTNYLDYKPNNLLFDFMIEFCKSMGSKILHLGGGYQEDDGLFKFKASFSNNNNYEYYIGKKVYDANLYNRINENSRKQYKMNECYFPIYRGKIERKTINP